jgi:hypothetical protein
MDPKIKKYIDYVVDNLLKKVVLDYDRKTITYSFLPDRYRKTFDVTYFQSNFIMFPLTWDFYEFIMERYGANEGEASIIWKHFKMGVKKMVDNE